LGRVIENAAMTALFFERPILNSSCGYPACHWDLDTSGQPTRQIVESRRADFITPIPKPRKVKGGQASLLFDEGKGLPGINHLGTHGRWAIAEFGDVYEMQEGFAQGVRRLSR
jgi:hypothetical protein